MPYNDSPGYRQYFEEHGEGFPLLMINGLGGTPISELYLLYRKAALNCRQRGFEIVRNYVGNYCTSLEMMGASLTLIRLDGELERLLDAPADIAVSVF